MNQIYAIALMTVAAILPAAAQSPSDTITDNNIVFPSSFSLQTDELHQNWYLQRYSVLEEKARRRTGTPASDAVYKERLQKLPTIIEMPYNQVVKAYIEMYATRKADLVEKMLGMSLYYMPIFEDAVEKFQAPQELKYLPVIESALDPNAVSRAGACGLWQFMTNTATGEGLEVNSLVDERRDPILSSERAVQYLQKLYNIYGDWTLAIAAYNCGPGNVNKAIQRAGGVKDYWAIYPFLPQETRGYVPAFIAANYIMNYYPEHGISHALARKPIVIDTVHVTKRVHFQQISDVLGIPMDELRILNPQYRADIIPGNIRPYALILPSMQAYCYVANEDSIIAHDRGKYFGRDEVEPGSGSVRQSADGGIEDLVVKTHTVRRGETLKTIARKYGVTVESIRNANNLRSSKVKRGTVLTINTYVKRSEAPDTARSNAAATPDGTDSVRDAQTKAPAAKAAKPQAQAKAAKTKTKTYTVRSGDSLDKIARRHGVTVKALMRANGLKGTMIHPKQKLIIPAK